MASGALLPPPNHFKYRRDAVCDLRAYKIKYICTLTDWVRDVRPLLCGDIAPQVCEVVQAWDDKPGGYFGSFG